MSFLASCLIFLVSGFCYCDLGREDIGWCRGGCDCDFAVEDIFYLFLFPVLLYISCFFFFFSNLFFVLINVVGLNNHLIPWPGPQDYNYPVARWFFVLGLFRSRFQTIYDQGLRTILWANAPKPISNL